MTAILDAIDDALTAYADHLGSPWPGRIPDTDELLEALFGPEDNAGAPTWDVLSARDQAWASAQVEMAHDCGECAEGDIYSWLTHEPRIDIGFTNDPFEMEEVFFEWPSWLAEEDAWLADRATREAATR